MHVLRNRATIMMESSPETVQHETRPERKRPLRTYGRRTQPETEPEAPSKRRKIEAPKPESARLLAGSDQPRSPELPKPEPATRGSILSFFKPLKSGPSASSSHTTSDPVDPASPPPSPPVLTKPRKRRRLTTRPDLETSDTLWGENATPSDEGGGENTPEGPDAAITSDALLSQTNGTDPAKSGKVESGVNGGPTEREQMALREVQPGTLNTAETSSSSRDGSVRTKRRARWRASQAKVQTTLSLSIKGDPGFRICKDCDMLYNPLNEKDRKDHARQHAASRRKKAAGASGRIPI